MNQTQNQDKTVAIEGYKLLVKQYFTMPDDCPLAKFRAERDLSKKQLALIAEHKGVTRKQALRAIVTIEAGAILQHCGACWPRQLKF
jgi:hypothetical protein